MSDLKHKQYEELLQPLTRELSAMARWVAATGQRIVILFEGRDTAGKGGRSTCSRGSQSAPVPRRRAGQAERERARRNGISSAMSNICRRRAKLRCSTAAGTIAPGSSRSWASATDEETDAFLQRRPGIRTPAGRRRHPAVQILAVLRPGRSRRSGSKSRLHNPIKRWKLSPIDIAARAHTRPIRWPASDARRDPHRFAPWTLVDFNDQALGRLTLLRDLLDRIPDTELPLNDIPWPRLPGPRQGALGVLEPIPNFDVRAALRSAAKSVA